MKCDRCRKGHMRQIVNVIVDASADCHNLSKTGLRSGDVKVLGVS